MALANFFDKSALAAAHLLQGFDRAAFEAHLLSAPVELAFDRSAVSSLEGVATLDLAVRLLSRLYPRLTLTGLDEVAVSHRAKLAALATAINPEIDLTEVEPLISLCVGDTHLTHQSLVFYLGSYDWNVLLSPNHPVGSGTTANPFAAGAAACFGAANVFRYVFADQLRNGEPDKEFRLSLLDFSHDDRAVLPFASQTDTSNPVDFGEAILVGLGAIGHGTLWALSRTTLVTGKLCLVDHEKISLSNLQRYVLAAQSDEGIEKTVVATAALRSTGIQPIPHPGDWASFLMKRGDWSLPLVLVAVDSAADRIAVQAALPARVLNAWTQASDLGVSRHFDFLNRPCLSCLYPPQEGPQSFSQIVAEAFGLPQREFELRALIENNAPVDAEWLAQIAKARGRELNDLKSFEGLPVRAFYQEVVCGGLLITTAPNQQTETPMAFQSALAGILLAAELVAATMPLRSTSLPTTTRVDLLRPLAEFLNEGAAKAKDGLCICQDADFREQYAAKYPFSL